MTIHYTNTSNPVDFPKLSTIDRLWGEALDRAVPDTYSTLTWTQVEKIKTVFAELIVAECCSKLVEMGESWHEFANNPPQGQAHNASGALFAAYRLKEDAVDEIKEHFGVEE